MGDFADLSLINGLRNLLNPPINSDSEEDECLLNRNTGRSSQSPISTVTAQPIDPNVVHELPNERSAKDLSENWTSLLPCPEYEIIYKQSIKTEDIFLQLQNKTPATASCEDIVIRIWLPDEPSRSVAQMLLDITETEILLKTNNYQLKLPIPHSVDPDQGTAKWDEEKKTLSIVLRLRREFDIFN